MEALRRIEQVQGNLLTVVLPDSFRERRVEVIVLPLEDSTSVPTPQRKPHPDIAGKGRIVGDIVSPVCAAEEWGALR